MRKTGPTKKSKRLLLRALQKQSSGKKQDIWNAVRSQLAASRRRETRVNVGKLSRLFGEHDTILLVAGKVLGSGNVEKPISVAAYSYSASAIEKIKNAKGKALLISALLAQNEKPSSVRIVK